MAAGIGGYRGNYTFFGLISQWFMEIQLQSHVHIIREWVESWVTVPST